MFALHNQDIAEHILADEIGSWPLSVRMERKAANLQKRHTTVGL